MNFHSVFTVALLSLVALPPLVAKDAERTGEFVSYLAAMSAAHSQRQSGDLEASRDALEEAVKLASNERKRCDAYRMLVSVYPETGDADKMFEALDHCIEHAPYPAFASLTLQSALAIARRKGLESKMRDRYEARLEKFPEDRTALVVMEKFTYLVLHDHRKRGEYIDRLIELDKSDGKDPNLEMLANRAFSYRLSREYVKSAELYESTAKLDKDLQAFCLMEAAEAWRRADATEKSIAAATQASELGPGKKARRSLYRWHRTLADIFLANLMKQPAEKHFEAALEEANIDAYRKQCTEKLALVRALKD
ncbi:MAG: hypothetical protein AB8B91_02070 [Rubripirellula sp.]